MTFGVSLIKNAFHLSDIKARDEGMPPLTSESHKAPFYPSLSLSSSKQNSHKMSSQFSVSPRQTASKRLDLSLFPGEIIKNQVNVLVNQRMMALEAENQILSSQIDQLGKQLKNERKDRIKYQNLLVESNACIQDIDQRMRRVCEEVEEQKKANLHLIDLMRGDHCGISRLAGPTQEELCGDCDDLNNAVMQFQPSNEEHVQGGSWTAFHPAADFATNCLLPARCKLANQQCDLVDHT